MKFQFTIYKKVDFKITEKRIISINRKTLNSAKNYIEKKYADFCIERL